MTPFEFADQYHQLQVQDSLLGLDVTLKISKYKAAWDTEDVTEASTVLDLVARKFLKLRGVNEVPAIFRIPNSPNADPTEDFCCAGIRRAFAIGDFDFASLSIAEWGEKGGKPQHNHGPYTTILIPNLLDWKPKNGWEKLHASLKKAMPNKKLIGYLSSSPDGTPAFRIFFSQGTAQTLDSRGWHTGNYQFGH